MGTTANFVKLRSNGTPQTGEWNINYDKALSLAKQNGKFIVTCWSNGDLCSYCTKAETCMMQQEFISWMNVANAYFVFQYSGDKDKGKTVHDWIYNRTKVSLYPGFRITLYDKSNPNKILVDRAVDGNTLRGNKANVYGAREMIANLNAIFALSPIKTVAKAEEYKVRLNEKLTTKQVNKILDAIDANDGYCPCQPKSVGDQTKCHCLDFVQNKKVGEPCICKIYVKKNNKKSTKRK